MILRKNNLRSNHYMALRLLCLTALSTGPVMESHAIPWPAISSPVITSCLPGKYTCSDNVQFAHSGTVMREIGTPTSPPDAGSSIITAFNIDCQDGDKALGIPFSNCVWDSHNAPLPLGDCRLEGDGTWNLEAGANCNTELTWRKPRNSSGPGGECLLFGQWFAIDKGSLHTPFGTLDAEVVANSDFTFCAKPPLPDIPCDISINIEIDHGTISGEGNYQRETFARVNCGTVIDRPLLEIVGPDEIALAPGITTKLSITRKLENPQFFTILSDLTVSPRAKAGEYSGTFILKASPF